MENIIDIMCVVCCGKLGKNQDVLLCNSCHLWHHRQCVKDVPSTYYHDFYVCSIQGGKPDPWMCRYCTRHQQTQIDSDTKTSSRHDVSPIPPAPGKTKPTSLHLPNITPLYLSSDADNADSDSSCDEFNNLINSIDTNRIDREGSDGTATATTTTTTAAVTTYTSPAGSYTIPPVVTGLKTMQKPLIPEQSLMLDTSRDPVLYSLMWCWARGGFKYVKDSHGNWFDLKKKLPQDTELYECNKDCGFQVRFCVPVGQFLVETMIPHTHVLARQNNQEEDDNLVLSPTIPYTPCHTPSAKQRRLPVSTNTDTCPDSSDGETATPYQAIQLSGRKFRFKKIYSTSVPVPSEDIMCSPVRAEQPPTPAMRPATPAMRPPTPAIKRSVFLPTELSEDDTDTSFSPFTPTVVKFQPLTTLLVHSRINASFTSSSSSDSEDLNLSRLCDQLSTSCSDHSDHSDHGDCQLSDLCDQLSSMSDSSPGEGSVDHDVYQDDDYPVPSPTETIPYLDSSESEDEDVTMTTTYTVATRTMSGSRTMLTDSHGYTYNVKFKLGGRVFWCCTEKSRRCPATVIQTRKETFTAGVAVHNHTSQSQPRTITTSQSQDSTPTASQPENSNTTSQSQTSNQKPHQSQTSCPTSRKSHTLNQITWPGTSTSEIKIFAFSPMTPSTYAEIDSCTNGPRRPKSLLIDSDNYIYTKKTENRKCGKNITLWKCGHSGMKGACQATVQFNYQTDFNTDLLAIHTWTVLHKRGTRSPQHNHHPDRHAVVQALIKTLTKKIIFTTNCPNVTAREVLDRVYVHIPVADRGYIALTLNAMKSHYSFAYRQIKIYENLPLEQKMAHVKVVCA